MTEKQEINAAIAQLLYPNEKFYDNKYGELFTLSGMVVPNFAGNIHEAFRACVTLEHYPTIEYNDPEYSPGNKWTIAVKVSPNVGGFWVGLDQTPERIAQDVAKYLCKALIKAERR